MLPIDAAASKLTDNPLSISWHDSAWVPLLNPTNVMDYFSERSNPFYDKQCNNEVLKMQRVAPTPEQLQQLQGLEYALLHVQEPILYVIRKQYRHSPVNVNPLADYYIVAGTVYQAPDLGSVFNSRLLTAVNHLQSAFEEARSYARYHPTKGYTWDFGGSSTSTKEAKAKEESSLRKSKKSKRKQEREKRAKEEPSSLFQRRRVDMLLDLLTRKFSPMKSLPVGAAATGAVTVNGPQNDAEKDTSQAAVVKSEALLPATVVKREATSAPRSNDSKKAKNS